MKKLLAVFLFLILVVGAKAQIVTTTGTIVDSDSTTWFNATVRVTFVPSPSYPNINTYNINGVALNSATYSSYLDGSVTTNGSGQFTISLLDNTLIQPAGSSWKIQIQSYTTAPSAQFPNFTVQGSTQDITSFIRANLTAPRFSATSGMYGGAFGYIDGEVSVTPVPGGSYFNVTSLNVRVWTGTQWVSQALGTYCAISGCNMTGPLFGPNINGEIYPADCEKSPAASWCTGTTADSYIRAACSQLPSTGGIINLLGLTGTLANSVTCSSSTKQVIMLEDPTSLLTVTESDGGTVFPLDEYSMFLGPGAGQCMDGGGIHLNASANITAIVAPAHTDGTQEAITVSGLCLYGTPGATVSQGLMYAKQIYANTVFSNNTAGVCNTACLKLLDVGETNVVNNWFNVEDGVSSITGSPLIIQGSGLGNGCNIGPVNVSGGQLEHAVGGTPEVLIEGDGSGLVLACDIHIHDVGIERTPAGTGSQIGISINDCKNCSVENVLASGVSSGSQAMIGITQNFANSIQNVVIQNISNIFGTYTNTLADTTTRGITLPFAAQDFITTYYSNPGYVQPPVLPGTVIQSLGSDLMSNQGNFLTGSANFGTNFSQTGCQSGQGLTCTYTRTNATAPPSYTYSQEVQITANTDTAIGFNGIQFSPSISFTAGVSYEVTFWGKGDGTFTGLPTFLLWNSVTPTFYCQNVFPTPFTTTWTLYTFVCQPLSSGSGTNLLAIAAETAVGSTGTFYIGGFNVAPVIPLVPGNLLSSVAPYGVGPATTTQQTITINSVACVLTSTCSIPPGAQASITQTAASSTGGTCTMSAGTTCTITLGHTYTTPLCVASQGAGTPVAASCSVSGTTVTITAASSNSSSWNALVFGNPN